MSDSGYKILLVEDEDVVRSGLKDNLECEGYDVVACSDGIQGLDTARDLAPDLIILDVMMPGMDGLEVCRRLRADGVITPIIMLTAKCAEVDKVVGLEIGADDYLTKPFGMRELFARVKALLRRSSRQPEQIVDPDDPLQSRLSFSDVIVDFESYRAQRAGTDIVLSAKEFELLRCLSSKPDIPFTRDQLLDHVWGYNNYPTTRTVDNFIARLRQKVEPIPDTPRHILTVHGVGYKFVQE
ncbi:MAG: response regulator transcription factor [Bdellovibrionales bacterium]|nr:response regulator transcription factor [Bdellovibrionales bacterium]